MLEFLKSDTFRRLLMALVGALLPLLNSKLGLNIPSEQVVAAIGGIAVWIAQSGWKAGQQIKADAHVDAAKAVAAGPTPSSP